MSEALIFDLMESCCIMDKSTSDDLLGGTKETWSEGAPIDAAIIKNSTTEAVVAEKQGVSEIFTIVTKSSVMLDYHDVIKRLSDGELFQVTSRGKDSEAPEMSTIPIRKVTAERWNRR